MCDDVGVFPRLTRGQRNPVPFAPFSRFLEEDGKSVFQLLLASPPLEVRVEVESRPRHRLKANESELCRRPPEHVAHHRVKRAYQIPLSLLLKSGVVWFTPPADVCGGTVGEKDEDQLRAQVMANTIQVKHLTVDKPIVVRVE